jgi:hypothetical protein
LNLVEVFQDSRGFPDVFVKLAVDDGRLFKPGSTTGLIFRRHHEAAFNAGSATALVFVCALALKTKTHSRSAAKQKRGMLIDYNPCFRRRWETRILLRKTFSYILLLARPKKDFALTRSENEYFAAITDPPSLETRRRRNVFDNLKTLVGDLFGELVSIVKLEPAGTVNEIWPSPVFAETRVKVSIQRDSAITSSRIYLAVKL